MTYEQMPHELPPDRPFRDADLPALPDEHLDLLLRAAERQLEEGEAERLTGLLELHPEYEDLYRDLSESWDALDAWQAPGAPRACVSRFQAALRAERRTAAPAAAGRFRRRWAAVPLAAAAVLVVGVALVMQADRGPAGREGAASRVAGGTVETRAGGLEPEGWESGPPVRAWRPVAERGGRAPVAVMASSARHLAHWDRQRAAWAVGIDLAGDSAYVAFEPDTNVEFVRTSAGIVDDPTEYVRPASIQAALDRSL